MKTKDPIERLREELMRPPLFSERNGYAPLDRSLLLSLLDEIETQYMRLPVDADGVPIRPGDEVYALGVERRVWAVSDDGVAFFEDDGDAFASECRHVKSDTVESILNELIEVHTYKTESCNEDVIADYAERIRKVVEYG